MLRIVPISTQRLKVIFFIDLLKYNYLSRCEGHAKMVHSLFRSTACYFSFCHYSIDTYLVLAQSLYFTKLLYATTAFTTAVYTTNTSTTTTTTIRECFSANYYYCLIFRFIFYKILQPHTQQLLLLFPIKMQFQPILNLHQFNASKYSMVPWQSLAMIFNYYLWT